MCRSIALFALISAVAATGCQRQAYVDRQRVDATPLVIDEAMQQRQWEPVTAYYENGDTYSRSTGFAYAPTETPSPLMYAGTDTGTFAVNVLTMPYTLFQQRDGVVSGGVMLPPSYTAVPVMPE